MRVNERWWSAYLHALVAAALLALPAIINRAPVYYEDTEAYLSRPATVLFDAAPRLFGTEWVKPAKLKQWDAAEASPSAESTAVQAWYAGRSVYWGVAAYAAVFAFGVWGLVAMNAILAGAVLAIAWHRCFDRLPPLLFPAVTLALAFASSLGVTVAMAMPDLLAALLIVGIALLATCWSRLLPIDRVVLVVVSIFAVLSHDTHLAIAALLLPFALLLGWLTRGGGARERLAQSMLLAVPVAAGLAGMLVFTAVAEWRTGAPPIRFPHLTAHVAGLDVGARYVREHCGRAEFAVCGYADRLPVKWTDFLFDDSPTSGVYAVAPPLVQRRLADEQYGFALAVARKYPGPFAAAMFAEGARQIGTFDLAEYDQRRNGRFYAAHFPPRVAAQVRETMLWRHPGALRWLQALNWGLTLTATLSIGALLVLHLAGVARLPDRAALFVSALIVGLLVNAFVCGILASPLGRFQARVVWLIPFAGAALLATAIQLLSVRKSGEEHVGVA